MPSHLPYIQIYYVDGGLVFSKLLKYVPNINKTPAGMFRPKFNIFSFPQMKFF